MADNKQAEAVVTPGATFVTAQFTWSGDTADLPGVFAGILSGSEGSWTFTLHPGGAGAVTAGTPRITLASDDPAVIALQLIDNIVAGSEAQVDIVSAGPVALESGGNLATLAGIVSATRAAVNLISGQAGITAGAGVVAANTPRITLASDDPAVIALQLLDNAISGSEIQVDVITLPSVTDGGAGKTLKRAVASLTADGNIVAAVATKRIKVYNLEIQSESAGMTVQLKSNNAAGTALGIPWKFDAREGTLNAGVNPPAFILATVAGEALYADLTGTGTINIAVSYWDDDTT